MSEEIIIVRESSNLSGTVRASGAKNSALKLMAASILGRGKTTVRNIPLISDIEVMADVLRCLGAEVIRTDHAMTLDTTSLNKYETPYELVSKMRASIAVLGPLIARFGCARVAMPGGCRIGARKIDIHLAGLEHLGVRFSTDHGFLKASTPKGLTGADITFDFPSVGATENVVMAATAAEGTTVIRNAAREPEIVDLCTMLNALGAKVSGAGTSVVTVEGVAPDAFHPCDYTTVGDRIEAGTFLAGGALTGGPVTVVGVDPETLAEPLRVLERMGCTVQTDAAAKRITVSRTRPLWAVDFTTAPYPGFPTDLQAQFMLLAAYADGTSVIVENVFENRFMFAAELMRMGADIQIEERCATVCGVPELEGAPVSSTDLRAGAALVLAGLVAEGQTHVYGVEHIDRGYEDYVGKLASLGADIARVTEDL
ncbi:MAG: UDP-N-acetylglucosamine 1-carboxyvinyltransferase [Eggerthellaceae bacterium]|nr:UDP-N-acetylglucosamine 1-carboxyvinyltransferase [Eggerthellaceae bacterium]